jgi:polyisoprenoid-binding protein YceI
MMITNVSGTFEKFDVQAEAEGADFSTASVEFTAEVDSISTGNADRDNHLKSPEFFDAAKYPLVKFVSTRIEKKDSENFVVYGDLTLRNVTRPVTLDVEFGGIGKDPWGNEKAGFTVSGKINRTEFDLAWNAALETGGVLVSEDVKLTGEIQLVRKA